MEDLERMNIEEFREKGYLQEVNRRFFHPLGLALEVIIDNDSDAEMLGGIWDYRNDESGIYYDIANSKQERMDRFKKNKEFIDSEFEKRNKKRIEILGFDIEPVMKIREMIK